MRRLANGRKILFILNRFHFAITALFFLFSLFKRKLNLRRNSMVQAFRLWKIKPGKTTFPKQTRSKKQKEI